MQNCATEILFHIMLNHHFKGGFISYTFLFGWVFKCVFKWLFWVDWIHRHCWHLTPVCFCQMYPQNVFTRGCIMTLVAFVWLFASVGCQMFPQTACTRAGIVNLVHYCTILLCCLDAETQMQITVGLLIKSH